MATTRSGSETTMDAWEKGQTVIMARLDSIDGKMNNLTAVVFQIQKDLQTLLRQSSQEAGVNTEFGEDRLDILYGLRQESSVEDFRRRFEFYSANLSDVSDAVLMGIFRSGLKEEIKRDLILFEINDLCGLIRAAEDIEERNEFGCTRTENFGVVAENFNLGSASNLSWEIVLAPKEPTKTTGTVDRLVQNKEAITPNLSSRSSDSSGSTSTVVRRLRRIFEEEMHSSAAVNTDAANPLTCGASLIKEKTEWSPDSSPRIDQIGGIQIPNFSSLLLTNQSLPPPGHEVASVLLSTGHQHRCDLKEPGWSSDFPSLRDSINSTSSTVTRLTSSLTGILALRHLMLAEKIRKQEKLHRKKRKRKKRLNEKYRKMKLPINCFGRSWLARPVVSFEGIGDELGLVLRAINKKGCLATTGMDRGLFEFRDLMEKMVTVQRMIVRRPRGPEKLGSFLIQAAVSSRILIHLSYHSLHITKVPARECPIHQQVIHYSSGLLFCCGQLTDKFLQFACIKSAAARITGSLLPTSNTVVGIDY